MDDRDPLTLVIEEDAAALQRTSVRRLPPFADTSRSLRQRAGDAGIASRRARWPVVVVGGASAVLLALVPLSYPTVSGHDVTLTLSAGLADSTLDELARGFQAGLGGDAIHRSATPTGTSLMTHVPTGSNRSVRAAVGAYAALLGTRGLDVDASVEPKYASRSGNVYAFASERLGRLMIDVRGRSHEEIEGDIRERLAAVGFRESRIRVTGTPADLTIGVQSTDAAGGILETEHRLATDSAGDAPPIAIELPDVEDLEHLPPAQRREAVERRLRANGIKARVTIEGDRLRIEAEEQLIRKESE